jgi:hypothetical protein
LPNHEALLSSSLRAFAAEVKDGLCFQKHSIYTGPPFTFSTTHASQSAGSPSSRIRRTSLPAAYLLAWISLSAAYLLAWNVPKFCFYFAFFVFQVLR